MNRLVATGETVTAVFVTFKRDQLLIEGLTRVFAQSRVPDEVIVIDNGSSEELESCIKNRFPTTLYVHEAENVGPAGGFEHGVRLALAHGSDWFWLFDDDASPKEAHCLETLLEACDSSVLTGQVKPTVEDPSNGKTMGAGIWHGSLVSAKAVESVGFPNGGLFFGLEDHEYSSRIARGGFSIVRCTKAIVAHKIPERNTMRSLIRQRYGEPPWRIYYDIRNRVWLCTRGNMTARLANSVLFVAKTLVKCLLFGRFPLLQTSAVLRGFADGAMGRLGRRVNP